MSDTNKLFSFELAPWDIPSPIKHSQIQAKPSEQQTSNISTINTIVHGLLDRKRRKLASGVAVHNLVSTQPNITGISTTVKANTSTTSTTTIDTNIVDVIPHTMTQSTQTQCTMAAQSSSAVETSVINTADIQCVSKSISGKYIVIAITDAIPSRKQINKGKGRPSKQVHHRRNDSLSCMIDFICANKSIPVYTNTNTDSWSNLIAEKNQLKRSQRDILKLVHNVLDKVSNGSINELLWSFLSLKCNLDIKRYIYSRLVEQDDSQLKQMLGNMGKCAMKTVDHCKYEWAMPVVPVFRSWDEAKLKGFGIGERAWNRAWRLFETTRDVTATIEKGYKVSSIAITSILL